MTALLLAILFLGMIELALADATDAQREARRFRERIASQIMADNAAEMAAAEMITTGVERNVERKTGEGEMTGRLKISAGGHFEIEGESVTTGLDVRSRVVLKGRVIANRIVIQESLTR